MIIATGMSGRVMLSVPFHSIKVRCEATCSEPRRQSQRNRTAKARDLLLASWFSGLGKQLEPVELLSKHALYSWRDLVESADDESTDTIRKLNAGVVAVADQLPGHASGNTGALKRPKASREPQNFRRRDVNDAQMFDSAAVGQLLAETTARSRINREVLRIV